MRPVPPTDPSAPFEAAIALAESRRFDEARTRALEIASQLPEESRAAAAQALARIARAAEAAQAMAAADLALEDALRMRPGYADLHFQHGALLARRGRLPEARRALEAALKIHARYLAARVELAMLDAREGRIGEALSALHELQRDSGIEEPRVFQQGMMSLESADWEAADTLLRRAVRGSDPRLERQLEEFRARMGDGAIERAAEVLREALTQHETYPDLHALLGSAEMAMGCLDDAVSSFARALELHPEYHGARLQLANALDALGERAAALDQVTLVLQREPEHAPALELYERWTPRTRQPGHSSRRKGS
jgi:tetratricopeptide (TPR) repeat protein